MHAHTDDIIAMATPAGQGGIGIVRVSGAQALSIAKSICAIEPTPRYAHYVNFYAQSGEVIDSGLLLFFPAPNSYTGEDIIELQAHGSPFVMDMLVRRGLELGARMARPGEFTERAFLNDRMDLAQAEAVADIIHANTEIAARSAVNALSGDFSNLVHDLVDTVTHLRIYVEAAIDFPDEEIDFLADETVKQWLLALEQKFSHLLASAKQGCLLREGFKVVLTGLPNAGKSSLLNALSQKPRAIVSDIPGTTRDTLEQFIDLDGLPIEIIDTAGIRQSSDEIEAEGIRRAQAAQQSADLVLLLIDDSQSNAAQIQALKAALSHVSQLLVVRNKIDVQGKPSQLDENEIAISVKTGEGLSTLTQAIKERAGYQQSDGSGFIARRRHLDALRRAHQHLQQGILELTDYQAGELLAEELYQCQNVLGEITGKVTSDDLLGHIFSSFCIGK